MLCELLIFIKIDFLLVFSDIIENIYIYLGIPENLNLQIKIELKLLLKSKNLFLFTKD